MPHLAPVTTDLPEVSRGVPGYFEFDDRGVPRDLFEVGTDHVLTDELRRTWQVHVRHVEIGDDPQGEEGACMATLHCEGKTDTVPLSRGPAAATVSLCNLQFRVSIRTLVSELPASLQP